MLGCSLTDFSSRSKIHSVAIIMSRSNLLLLFQTTLLLSITSGFMIIRKGTRSFGERAILSMNDANTNIESTSIADMTSKQIQSELQSLGVSYKDCFDKESLVKRLRDMRSSATKHNVDQKEGVQQTNQNDSAVVNNNDTTRAAEAAPLDKEALRSELRKLRVSELRSKLGEQGIRWSNMIEKEDLVNALLSNMESKQDFSKSKSLTPGKVNEVTGDILSIELSSKCSSPLLLDGELDFQSSYHYLGLLLLFSRPSPFLTSILTKYLIIIFRL